MMEYQVKMCKGSDGMGEGFQVDTGKFKTFGDVIPQELSAGPRRSEFFHPRTTITLAIT